MLILVADDDALARRMLTDSLSAWGYDVETVSDGDGAWARLQEEPLPPLVIADWMMPGIEGVELCRRIREDARLQSLYVILYTSRDGKEDLIEALRAGADDYVIKPFDPAELEARVRVGERVVRLQRALTDRVAQLQGALAEIRELENVRADFYSMVTHDLRNPAGTVKVALKRVLDGKAGDVSEKQRQFLEISMNGAERMLGLINDYLDYAKIDAGYLTLELAEIDLRVVVEESARLIAPQADARSQSLVVSMPEEPVLVLADAERLEQVVDNLLSNALKYTPEGGRVRVAIEESAGEVLVRVFDTGRGIAPDQIGSLFTKYHRIPGEVTRGIRGTGLGLLIAKEMVEAHGGRIWAESEGVRGKGSVFTFSLPVGADRHPGERRAAMFSRTDEDLRDPAAADAEV